MANPILTEEDIEAVVETLKERNVSEDDIVLLLRFGISGE